MRRRGSSARARFCSASLCNALSNPITPTRESCLWRYRARSCENVHLLSQRSGPRPARRRAPTDGNSPAARPSPSPDVLSARRPETGTRPQLASLKLRTGRSGSDNEPLKPPACRAFRMFCCSTVLLHSRDRIVVPVPPRSEAMLLKKGVATRLTVGFPCFDPLLAAAVDWASTARNHVVARSVRNKL